MSEEKTDTIKAKIYRYDPTRDEEPYYDVFEVPKLTDGQWIVSKLLEYIFENLDRSLAFYYTCNRAHCDACTVLINGEADLACIAVVEGDEIVLEPPEWGDHVRDLVTARNMLLPAEILAEDRVEQLHQGHKDLWYKS
jgi:succinate dehydrogenase/fumarate reductase-like Fe-S protein